MKSKHITNGILLAALGALLLVLSGCSGGNAGKVPITTSSSEALDNYVKGRDLVERLRAPESIPYFEKAVQLDPNFALAHLRLAQTSSITKEFMEHLDRARALADSVSEGERLWIVGAEAASIGQQAKARECFHRMVEMYPDDERAHNTLGDYYFGQQQWEEAIDQYNKAIAINPKYSPSYNTLGYSYRFLGRLQDAEHAFRRYIKLIPDDPNPYDSYGELLLKMGRYNQSIQSYEKALAINPAFAASHLGIATNLNLKEKHDKARAQLAELYDIAPSDVQRQQALFGMAVSYADEGKLDSTLVQLQRAYDLAEKGHDVAGMANTLFIMEMVYVESGDFDRAESEIQKAAQVAVSSDLDPQIIENGRRTYLYLATRLYLEEGKSELGKERLDEFKSEVKRLGDNPAQVRLIHELNGYLASCRKDHNKAIDEFSQANQQDPVVLYHLAAAYEAKGDIDKARETYLSVANLNQVNSLGWALVRNKARKRLTTL